MQMRPSSSSSVSWMVLDSHAWCLTACANISSISSTLCSLQMSPFSVVPDSVFIPVCSSQASDCSVTMASPGSFPARDRYQAAADAASWQGHCTWAQWKHGSDEWWHGSYGNEWSGHGRARGRHGSTEWRDLAPPRDTGDAANGPDVELPAGVGSREHGVAGVRSGDSGGPSVVSSLVGAMRASLTPVARPLPRVVAAPPRVVAALPPRPCAVALRTP